MILAFRAYILFFNELYHDYLFVKACSMTYYISFIKIVLFDYCRDLSLQFGDKLEFR